MSAAAAAASSQLAAAKAKVCACPVAPRTSVQRAASAQADPLLLLFVSAVRHVALEVAFAVRCSFGVGTQREL